MIFLKTPKFWSEKPNFALKVALKPISEIYSYVSTKNYFKDYKYKSAKSRVVAIGGITVGGSGKTVVVQSICEILKRRKIAVLSRGFGRSSDEILRVDNKIHSYKEAGDEPLALSNSAPVYVGKDRSESAKLAERDGFNFLILDDGIVQRYLKPDVKLIVIDGEQRFGNGEMFPLGPNRLDFQKIKSDIDGAIILNSSSSRAKRGEGQENDLDAFDDLPVFHGTLKQDFSQIKKKRIIPFCGIGYPDKFFNSLAGFDIVEKIAFPDHYPFSEADLENLVLKSQRRVAQLVTTEKDLMRIPQKYRDAIAVVSVKVEWTTSIKSLTGLLCSSSLNHKRQES